MSFPGQAGCPGGSGMLVDDADWFNNSFVGVDSQKLLDTVEERFPLESIPENSRYSFGSLDTDDLLSQLGSPFGEAPSIPLSDVSLYDFGNDGNALKQFTEKEHVETRSNNLLEIGKSNAAFSAQTILSDPVVNSQVYQPDPVATIVYSINLPADSFSQPQNVSMKNGLQVVESAVNEVETETVSGNRGSRGGRQGGKKVGGVGKGRVKKPRPKKEPTPEQLERERIRSLNNRKKNKEAFAAKDIEIRNLQLEIEGLRLLLAERDRRIRQLEQKSHTHLSVAVVGANDGEVKPVTLSGFQVAFL